MGGLETPEQAPHMSLFERILGDLPHAIHGQLMADFEGQTSPQLLTPPRGGPRRPPAAAVRLNVHPTTKQFALLRKGEVNEGTHRAL